MTTLTLDLDFDVTADAIVPGDAPRERPTLDDLVVGVWEGLHAHHPAPCPICSGTMTPRYGSGPRPVGGRCGDCGTGLA
ncbi:MAG TPA: hypothetical protein VGP78_06810 [Solirubrobacteraceae bacterium]|jgi:hypothetical protein|nr:hypothetical protein [Solirubrobacteraceae bacterium]